MTYLLFQMLFYLVGALLLGLLLGWILWGRRGADAPEVGRLRDENNRLARELAAYGEARAGLERAAPSNNSPAEAIADTAPAEPARPSAEAEQAQSQPVAALMSVPAKAQPKKMPKTQAAEKPVAAAKASSAPKAAPAKKPKPMVQPDDLRRIVGIGPVNERLLHGEGVRTFAQIAKWTAAEVRRIEAVLQFDGRIERERWIEQAALLAAGKEQDFAQRFPTAGSGRNT